MYKYQYGSNSNRLVVNNNAINNIIRFTSPQLVVLMLNEIDIIYSQYFNNYGDKEVDRLRQFTQQEIQYILRRLNNNRYLSVFTFLHRVTNVLDGDNLIPALQIIYRKNDAEVVKSSRDERDYLVKPEILNTIVERFIGGNKKKLD